ncbi:hypothetical protein [Modestobacter roseus]|uniref:Uncharacterized protein n=1 Tax=Modestobacter roseus TaxID=1181884 RepID=A0A562IT51_9ACTN|nr:hypothetical protein [Modestobacter roseus]MQA36125.1 hypothetical protein [Modestobacter roseus]TWH74010.1 hypothetical protein JD78_02542 [Modestobacter roseus]
MREPDGDELDALLRDAGRVQRTRAEDEQVFTDVWSRVQAAMDDDPAGSGDDLQRRRLGLIGDREVAARRRRRTARLATVTLAVVVAGSGTAAAAAYIATRTGEELTGWEVGAGGSGEVLDLEGTDLAQVVEEATADIVFAPGYAAQRDRALAQYGQHDLGSAITESHLRSGVAGLAVCTWADAWVAADATGDVAARAAATETLSAALSWEPFLTFATDHQEPLPAESTGEGSYRWWMRPLAEAARAGDRQAVLDAVADSATCGWEYLPVIDADPAYEWHGLR